MIVEMDTGGNVTFRRRRRPLAQATRLNGIEIAAAHLKEARKLLAMAGAPQARAAVARALKSAEGAARHASRGLPASTRRASRPALRLFLVVTLGDVEPELRGPFRNEAERIAAARSHRATDPEQRDGLFRLDVSPNGRGARVWSFLGWETDPNEELCICGHPRGFHTGEGGHGACGKCMGKAAGCARFTWTAQSASARRPADAPQLRESREAK